jgi:hypothetical protein
VLKTIHAVHRVETKIFVFEHKNKFAQKLLNKNDENSGKELVIPGRIKFPPVDSSSSKW